jgi:DNA-binding beta-propeller fold protein YncE
MYLQSILCLTCNETEFECKHSGQCVDKVRVCDNVKDCHLGEDEHDCPLVCKDGETVCGDKHRCVDNKLFCDGYEDCDDGSDEKFCPAGSIKLHTCDPDHFSCPGEHFCMPNHFKCDGHKDCENGEDEKDCEGGILQDNNDCPSPNYKCEDSEGTCIAARHVCDGESDCIDGIDEQNCGNLTHYTECLLSEGKYACHEEFGYAEVVCIELNHLCDGKPQCPLNEDEGVFCNSTTCANYGCQHECVQTPKGAQCVCSPGYSLAEDGMRCADVDECSHQYGICDHICKNTQGSYECSCLPDYSLHGKSHCQFIAGTPELLITSFSEYGGEIRSFNPLTKEYLLIVENLTVPVGVGYDEASHAVIWTDAHEDHPVVESASLISSRAGKANQFDVVSTLVETGIEMPEDLVVDALSNLVYFTDSIKGTVSACNIETINCSVISKNHQKPRGLAIHSKKKFLYVTEYGDEPKIVRMSQDGSNSVNIVYESILQNISMPNGIFVDETIDRIFWADATFGTINSANLDGSDFRVVVKDYHHPFGVAVFEDRVYWTDWQYYVLRSANKFTGNDIRTELKSNKWQLNGLNLHVTGGLQKDKGSDPCEDNACSHLCLPRGEHEFTCACPEQMYLGLGSTSCRHLPSEYDASLYVSSENTILSLSPQNLGVINMETVGFESGLVTSVSAETVSNNLVASTSNNDLVVVNTNWKTSNVIATGIEVEGISYDHTNLNIFWVDSSKKSIIVMSETTNALRTLINCTHPKALHYVHSKHRLAYIDGTNLLETDMNGSQIYLLTSDLPEDTSGLVFDESERAYYFADQHFIYRYGEGGTTYSDVARIKSKPLSLVTQKGYLYWTLKHSNKLFWLDLTSNFKNVKVFSLALKGLSGRAMHLSASKVVVDKSMGACSNKHCSDICVVTEENLAHCLCGDGRTMVQDQQWNTCKAVSGPSTVTTTLSSLSKEYIGLIACLSAALVLTFVLMCGCCFLKKKGPGSMEFINRSFGKSPTRRNERVQEMSPVGSYKNGTLNELYNPSYYSVSLASCQPIATSHTPVSAPTFSTSFLSEQEKKGIIPSIMRSIRKLRDPKMSTLDLGVNASTSYESLDSAKSSSTPTSLHKRKMETIEEADSACSLYSGGQNSMEDDISVCSDTVQLVNKY